MRERTFIFFKLQIKWKTTSNLGLLTYSVICPYNALVSHLKLFFINWFWRHRFSDIAEEPEEDDLTDTEDNRVTINKKILVNSNHNNNNNVSNSLYKASKVNVWAEPALALNTSQSSTLKQSSTTLLQSSTTNLQSSTTLMTPDKPLNTTLVIIDNKNNKTEQKINSNLEFSTTQHNRNNERMRIFVALFDYDPPTMSPNPDACDEELPFREGQLIIKVLLKSYPSERVNLSRDI